MSAVLASAPGRNTVLQLEDTIRSELSLVDLPVRHFFGRKSYVRELTIPKNTVLTGKIHKHACVNVLLKGDMSVMTETGITRVQAPYIFNSPAGVKRVGYAHEDSLWVTIHGTDEVDLEAIENDVIANSFEEFDQLSAADQVLHLTEEK